MSDIVERLRAGVPEWTDHGPGGDLEITRYDTDAAETTMAEAADEIERLTKERDEARGYAAKLRADHKDEADRLRSLWDADAAALARAREELTFFRPAIEHIAKLNGTYVHVAINAATTAAVALKAVKDAAALAPEGK